MRNAALPVNRLPPEIFKEIFSGIVDYEKGNILHLISSTHVCSRWRQMALNMPSLWTTFSLRNIPAAKAFLRRSQALPLSLSLTTSFPTNYFRDFIITNFHRLRSLRLSIRDKRNMMRILTQLPPSGAAPLLETLVLEVQYPVRVNQDNTPIVPTPLFEEIPSLRTLKLIDANVLIPISKPSAITNLDITCNNVAGYQLLVALRNCPILEILRCRGTGRFATEPVTFGHSIELPQLRSLFLDMSSPTQTIGLLSQISIPQSCTLEIRTGNFPQLEDAWGYNMLPDNASSNLKCLSNICQLALHYNIRRNALDIHAFHVNGDISVPPVKFCVFPAMPQIETFYGGWPFDVSSVKTLILSGLDYPIMRADRWRSMLRSLSGLKTLRVLSLSTPNADALLETLQSTEQSDSDTGPERCFAVCPLLSTLELYDVPKYASFSSKILSLIPARYRLGQLREVELFNAGGFDANSPWIASLEEYSPGVTVRAE